MKYFLTFRYVQYARCIPKQFRKPGDPQTPEPHETLSTREWNEKINTWKSALNIRNQRSAEASKHLLTPSLTDSDTQASFEKTVGNFAILKLANGKKAFAHISRIWIFKQPMFGGFRALSHPAYKDKININARSITPIKDVEYQVTYCHAGLFQ